MAISPYNSYKNIRGGFSYSPRRAYNVNIGGPLGRVGSFVVNRYGEPVGRAIKDKVFETADNIAGNVINKIQNTKLFGSRTSTNQYVPLPNVMTRTGRPGRPKSPSTGVVSIGKGMTATSFAFKGKAKTIYGNDVSRFRTYTVHGSSVNANNTTFGLQQQSCKLIKTNSHPYPAQGDFLTAMQNLFGASDNVNEYFLQLQKLKVTMVFHNMDRVTVKMDLYDIVFDKDNSNTDADLTSMNPGDIWNKALTKITSGTAPNNTFPDSTPYNLPYFNNYYRILKRHVIYLAPGYSHTHTFESSGHYPFRETRLYQNGILGMKGMSYAPMLVVKSAPVRDANDNNVSLGTPDIIFATTVQADWVGKSNALRLMNVENTFDSTIVMENVRPADSAQIVATSSTEQTNNDSTADTET